MKCKNCNCTDCAIKFKNGVSWHDVLVTCDECGQLEQHLVADEKGEDINAYNRRDEIMEDIEQAVCKIGHRVSVTVQPTK